MKPSFGMVALLVVAASACSVEPGNGGSASSDPGVSLAAKAGLIVRTAASSVPHVQRFPGDYDGDGKTDLTVWRPSNGYWFVTNSSGATRQDVQWGVYGDVPVTGDYDGDGKSDRAVWRPDPTASTWFVNNSSGAARQDIQWGIDGDIPVPGDYDGDGKTDRAVWRPSSGYWFVLNSSGAARQDVQWGIAGDIPAPGDYDGDGKTDRAVWRPSSGTWFVIYSSGAPRQDVQWGSPGDIPVPGDYDGDGKTDRAVWRPSPTASTWKVLQSSNGQENDVQWGLLGDVPVPGDYDGDGKTDPAVWRAWNATWWVAKSSGGTSNSVWGTDGDIAMPNNPDATTSWRPLLNPATFGAEQALLLTDGTVMVQETSTVNWWRLKPDAFGNYWSGTWSQLAPLPAGYSPRYFASAVLPDGRVIVEGGEYNGQDDKTSKGAIYNPFVDVNLGGRWTSVAPPSGWSNIGDAPSVVLANGTFMLGEIASGNAALLNASTLTWTATGFGKADANEEEGWTLLPNNKVLTVDCNSGNNASEVYDPVSGSWTSAGITSLPLEGTGGEIGPALVLSDGRVLATGATRNTDLLGTDGIWRPGPQFPTFTEGQMTMDDGPAVLLPNGNALLATTPEANVPGVHYLEFDGTNLAEVPRTPNSQNLTAQFTRLLVLPTGQVLMTDMSNIVQIYHPRAPISTPFAPTISSAPANVTRGLSYMVQGTQFNGVSQAEAFGDDAQAATNYPLVRITNNATGHVFYARTHGHSTMGIATGSLSVSTTFDVPTDAETGASKLVVVANGVPSEPVNLTVN